MARKSQDAIKADILNEINQYGYATECFVSPATYGTPVLKGYKDFEKAVEALAATGEYIVERKYDRTCNNALYRNGRHVAWGATVVALNFTVKPVKAESDQAA